MKATENSPKTPVGESKVNAHEESEYEHPVDKGWSWAICFASFLSYFLTGISIQGQSVLFLEMVNEFHTSYTVTSLSLMVFVLAFSLSSILSVTIFVPKYGERSVTITAGFIFSLCSAGFAASTAIEGVIALSGVQGAAAGTIVVPVISMMGHYFKNRISLAMSIASSGICFASIMAPPTIRALFKEFGLRNTYLILSGIEINMVTAGLLLRPVSSYRKKVNPNTKDLPQVDPSDHVQITPQPEVLAEDDSEKGSSAASDHAVPRVVSSILKSMSVSSIDEKVGVVVQSPSRHRYRSVTFASILEEKFSVVSSDGGKEQQENITADKDGDVRSSEKESEPLSDDGNGPRECDSSVPGEQENDYDIQDYKHDFIRGLGHLFHYGSKAENEDDAINNTQKTDRNEPKRERILSSSVSLEGDEGRRLSRENAANRKRSSVKLDKGPIRRKLSTALWLEVAAAGLERDLMEHDEESTACERNCFVKIVRGTFSMALFKQRVFLVFLMAVVPGATNQYLLTYIPVIAEVQGSSKDQAALVTTICGSVDLCSRIAMGYLADNHVMRSTQLVSISQFFLGTVCQLNHYFRDFHSILIMGALMGLFIGTRMTLMPMMLIELMGVEMMARGLSITSMLNTFSAAIHGPMLSAVVQKTGSVRLVLFYVGTTLMVSAVALFLTPLFIEKEEKKGSYENGSETTLNVSDDQSEDSHSSDVNKDETEV